MGHNNSTHKLFVVGANGYIGRLLFDKASFLFDTYGTSSSGANGLLPLKLEEVDKFNFQCLDSFTTILLTAAISAPDTSAREQERVWTVNVTGTSKFISKAMDRGARVIFFSSDTVYGEQAENFEERTKCNPIGDYAIMKHAVEQRFAASTLFKTIRLSYVFSREDKFTRYLDNCAQRNEEADLFHPFLRAIVHRDDVIEGVLALVSRWDEIPESIINCGGPQVLSRVEFAECLRVAHLHELKFQVKQPKINFFKNRPRIIAMKSPVFARLLGRSPRTLDEAAHLEFASPSSIERI